MKEPEFRHFTDDSRRIPLRSLREKVTPLLEIDLFPHFTDHGPRHSDRLVEIVEELVEPIQRTAAALSDDELTLLYSACYLHDAGMHYKNISYIRTITELRLEQPWDNIPEDSRQEIQRRHHASISADLIILSVGSEAPPLGLPLTEEYNPGYLASLCAAHTLPVESDLYRSLLKTRPNIRMLLLSALLRMADILDESSKRALTVKRESLSLDTISQAHWRRHYYTEEVTFNVRERSVTLHFGFPGGKEKEYGEVVPRLQVPLIEEEFRKHALVFNQIGGGVVWFVKSEVLQKIYSSTEAMPYEVLFEMRKELHKRKLAEKRQRDRILCQSFRDGQPLIDRRLEELQSRKHEMLANEHLRSLAAIAKDVYELEGKRSSWLLLVREFTNARASLAGNEQVSMGTWLAGVMLEDEQPGEAWHVLSGLEEIVEGADTDGGQKVGFYELKAHVMIDLYRPNDAIQAIQKAIRLADDGQSRDRLQAQASELRLMQAEILLALNLASGEESIE